VDPDFYIRYYKAIENSPVHSSFCRDTFGIDLGQHGFADIKQIELIATFSNITQTDRVIDIGCGNGMITEYLFNITGASFTGLDNVSIAIQNARKRTISSKNKLQFIEGDINDLHLPHNYYNIICDC
jgi:ubiquinone/menaquinone biosynthesis C-methylase UbiE